MRIRRERPTDQQAIGRVHDAAFPDVGGSSVESRLVAWLRADAGWLPKLSLVAEVPGGGDRDGGGLSVGADGRAVAGHVVASRAWLDPVGRPALGLGPLAVLPEYRRSGVGAALMYAVLAAAEALDESVVGLVGDPGYYRRFGFAPASTLGIDSPDPTWGGHFQALLLDPDRVPTAGRFRYAEPFDRLG